MESAYGMAIIITLISVTFLMFSYISVNKKLRILGVLFFAFYLFIEAVFFVASLQKFVRGGAFAIVIAVAIMFVMVV